MSTNINCTTHVHHILDRDFSCRYYLFIYLFIFEGEGGGGGVKLYMNIKFFPFGTLFAFILFILPVVYANKVKLL